MEVAAAAGPVRQRWTGAGQAPRAAFAAVLPRRLTLDFRDIFSEGFAFDSIEGKLDVKKGVMRTREDLAIDGPAARVLMKGGRPPAGNPGRLVTVQPSWGRSFRWGLVAGSTRWWGRRRRW